MNCVAARHRADRDWEATPDPASRGVRPEVWNRQAAALCLAAAAETEDTIERAFLRRRAADLILTRRDS